MAAVEVKIYGIVLDEESKVPVIILKVVEGVEKLFIQVGIIEASAIAAAMEEIKLPRPMTHDLLASVISSLGGSLQRIEVTDLKDSTFYANLYVKIGKRIIEIDSRPSDAIATAVRLNSPIFV
ncbi:MAG: bifunctional nuclease family protein, partial [Deltaproteobacteria bacterium]|nr:bifunctional nuclease family protein [Deltaproteobacteria bacterium]